MRKTQTISSQTAVHFTAVGSFSRLSSRITPCWVQILPIPHKSPIRHRIKTVKHTNLRQTRHQHRLNTFQNGLARPATLIQPAPHTCRRRAAIGGNSQASKSLCPYRFTAIAETSNPATEGRVTPIEQRPVDSGNAPCFDEMLLQYLLDCPGIEPLVGDHRGRRMAESP